MSLSRTFQRILHESDLDYDAVVAVFVAFTVLLLVVVVTSL
ncbi:MAG TPA: hypothetical protein VFO83_11955 [Aggregicoccus sp.]|nr:hypothetical protein [Aggregicoccus sp.]